MICFLLVEVAIIAFMLKLSNVPLLQPGADLLCAEAKLLTNLYLTKTDHKLLKKADSISNNLNQSSAFSTGSNLFNFFNAASPIIQCLFQLPSLVLAHPHLGRQ